MGRTKSVEKVKTSRGPNIKKFLKVTEKEKTELLKAIKTGKGSKGQSYYRKFLNGGSVTYKGAVLAKCFECMGYYTDGRIDCGDTSCPLSPFRPYQGVKIDE